jgi:hypothetical protein
MHFKDCIATKMLRLRIAWVLHVLCPSSGDLETRKQDVSETDLLPSSGEGWGKNIYSVRSLRKS